MRWRDVFYLKDHVNDDVVIFFGNYEDFTTQDIEILSEEEKTMASAIPQLIRRNHYLAGKAFLRRTLGHMLESGPYKGILAKDIFGKPYIVNNKQNIHFNISHTGTIIAIVFSFIKPIGIDIEFKGRNVPEYLVDYFLNEAELREIFSGGDWRECFLRIWIRKEAVLKCIGCGFTGNPKEIKVSLKDEGLLAYKVFSNNKWSQVWHFLPIEYSKDIIGVVAV